MAVTRWPAVAGQFYSDNARELSQAVATLLDEAQVTEEPAPKALIVPHAGYMYSGPIAARAYAILRSNREHYRRVILLGPSHRTPLRGMALSSADYYQTPLGDVPLDREIIGALAAQDELDIRFFDAAHEYEHSLEVHLPFLQAVLGDFELVPIVVGDTEPERVADLLDKLWGGPETLIVISSDLSHYLPYEKAATIDARTCSAIEQLDGAIINHSMACGATPVRGLLLAARKRGMDVTTLDLRNSADTAGDRSAVVGYGAWMFT